MPGAVGYQEFVRDEAAEQISGDCAKPHDAVAVALDERDDAAPDLAAPPIGVGDEIHRAPRQQQEDDDHRENARQRPVHQKASPMERWSTSRSKIVLPGVY